MESPRKLVPIELDRTRNLCLDFNALLTAERASGESASEWNLAGGKVKLSVLRALLWAGLLHEDPRVKFDDYGNISRAPELTIQRCGDFLVEHDPTMIFTAIVESFTANQTPAPPLAKGQ